MVNSPSTTLPLDGLCCKRGCKKLTLFSSGFPLSGINSAQQSLRREISGDYLILSGIHAMLMKLVLFSPVCFGTCWTGRGRCCALETSAQFFNNRMGETSSGAGRQQSYQTKQHRGGGYRTSCQRQKSVDIRGRFVSRIASFKKKVALRDCV